MCKKKRNHQSLPTQAGVYVCMFVYDKPFEYGYKDECFSANIWRYL